LGRTSLVRRIEPEENPPVYFATDEPRPAPFNADELTPDHVTALSEFLAARILELRGQDPANSAMDRAVRSLHVSAGALIDQLNGWFEDEESETLRGRMHAWNRAVFAVWPWEGTDGYDAFRWRLVKHVDAEEAVAHARLLLQRREEIAAEKRTEREGV
jgi:hypothetical protein